MAELRRLPTAGMRASSCKQEDMGHSGGLCHGSSNCTKQSLARDQRQEVEPCRDQAELQEPWALADSHGRPITRGRVVFAFWALAAMTLVCWAAVIWVTETRWREARPWHSCSGSCRHGSPALVGLYLLWRLGPLRAPAPEERGRPDQRPTDLRAGSGLTPRNSGGIQRRRSPRCERTQLLCGHAEIQKQHSRTTRDSRLKAFQYPVVDPAL